MASHSFLLAIDRQNVIFFPLSLVRLAGALTSRMQQKWASVTSKFEASTQCLEHSLRGKQLSGTKSHHPAQKPTQKSPESTWLWRRGPAEPSLLHPREDNWHVSETILDFPTPLAARQTPLHGRGNTQPLKIWCHEHNKIIIVVSS